MEFKETYLKTVYKHLHGPWREKKGFLWELRDNIDSFIEQSPNATYADIEKNFGSPEEIGQAFDNCLEPQIAERLLHRKTRVLFLVCSIAVVTACIIVGFLVVDYIEWKRFSNGYYVETIIISEDEASLPELPEESTNTIRVYK